MRKHAMFLLCFLFLLKGFTQIPTNGLVAHYPFSGNANDASGNGNHGTVYGATLTTDRCGNPNSAYNFNGNSYIKVPYSASLNSHTNELTLSFWVYSTNAEMNPICKSGWGTLNIDYRLQLYNSGNFSFIYNSKESSFSYTNILNQWLHYAFVYNNGLYKLYRNGLLMMQQTTVNTTFTLDKNTDLYIGLDPAGLVEYMQGKLDDIYIYNRALTDNEIFCLYHYQLCPSLLKTDTIKICKGKSVTLPNGKTYSKDTLVYDAIPSRYLCDSLVAWQVVVSDCADTTLLDAVICEGDVYLENGFNDSVSGIYTKKLQNSSGQDSIVILNLNVKDEDTTQFNITICEGETYQENGFNCSKTDTYFQNLKNHFGCDSLVILNLNVLSPTKDTLFASICDGEIYSKNGFSYSKTGTYVQKLKNIFGCDSTVILNLTVNPTPDIEITAVTNNFCDEDFVVLQITTDGTSFIWNTGSMENIITITASGVYTATASLGNCEKTATYTVEYCPCDLWLPNAFTPNNDQINDVFAPVVHSNLSRFSMHIYDRWGQLMYKTESNIPWDGTINGRPAAAGVYFCIISYSCANDPTRIFNKHGSVTLIR